MPAFRPWFSVPTIRVPGKPRLRVPRRRELAVAAIAAVLLAGAYAVARETSLFAVRTIEVEGATPEVSAEVHAALAEARGESLVAIDADALARGLIGLPSVQRAQVDRAFPHGLVVAVVPEEPLGLIRRGADAWVIAASGTVIRRTPFASAPGLPKLRVDAPGSLEPGTRLTTREAKVALAVLRAVPPRFPAIIGSVRGDPRSVVLVLRGWIELRLGPASDVPAKLASAAAVLRSLPPDERRTLAYLDVSLPQRPVAAYKSQLESES